MHDHIANVTAEWSARLRASVDRTLRGERDFRWLNLGDSIATGEWGIASTEQHYVAVAARRLGERYGIPSGRHLHTAGHDFTDGTVQLSNPSEPAPGDFFGSRGWDLRAGDRLRYVPGAAVARYIVNADGAVRWSTDDGASWIETAAGYSAIGVPEGAVALVVTPADSPVHIGHLGHEPIGTAMSWYTSGIGASRIADLHAVLGAEGGRGYAAYGAANPDLLSLEIGVNNTIHADEVTLERSVIDLRRVLRSFQESGVRTIALVGANPVRADFQPGRWGVEDAYRSMYYPLAEEFGVPIIDVARRWSDYDRAHARGFLEDQVHPTALGHEDLATTMMALF